MRNLNKEIDELTKLARDHPDNSTIVLYNHWVDLGGTAATDEACYLLKLLIDFKKMTIL